MKRVAALLLAAPLLLVACGEPLAPPGPVSTTTTTAAPGTTGAGTTSVTTTGAGTTTTTLPSACEYYQIEGCTLYGLVLANPLPTAAVREAVGGFPGVPIAVWRTDLTCVPQTNMGAPGPVTNEPSRFAYVDAEGIRQRRLATSGTVAPPITGLHISESYWIRWESQWAQAQQEGVLLEAVAVYLPTDFFAAGPPAGFAAVVVVPWRRTDSIDPSYSGELLLESEEFPAGYLSEPAPIGCE